MGRTKISSIFPFSWDDTNAEPIYQGLWQIQQKKKVSCTFLYQDVAEMPDTFRLLKPCPPNISLKDKEIMFCILRACRTAPGLLAVILLKVIVNCQSVSLLTVFRDVWWMELYVGNMNSKGTPCLDNCRTGCCFMKFEKSRYFPWEGA